MTPGGGDVPQLWVDIGGTFTDAVLVRDGRVSQTKVLSSGRVQKAGDFDPAQIPAGTLSPIIAAHQLLGVPHDRPLPPLRVRLGTTRGTNALLTGQTAPVVLLITEGFADLPIIGDQRRPDLFDLQIRRRPPIADAVVEIPERIAADGGVLRRLDLDTVEERLKSVIEAAAATGRPIAAAAVCTLHSVVNDAHERAVAELATRLGIGHVIGSAAAAAEPRFVPRMQTALIDAALAPVLTDYVARVQSQFGPAADIGWMTSGGRLVPGDRFAGHDSVLSGPAGGAVALSQIAARHQTSAVGLDMGGTSTDVCRCHWDAADGTAQVARRGESTIAGLSVIAPAMDIHTVAAGGGSICRIESGRLLVGPGSAGADPGPACYGRGGPLTLTDLNVVLGRLPTDRFNLPIDRDAAVAALREVAGDWDDTAERLAEGFLDIAVTQMAEAVRAVTTAAGVDVRQMALVGFGGSAGGHVCRVADALQVRRVIDPPRGGVLSAVGIGAAGDDAHRSVAEVVNPVGSASSTASESLGNALHGKVSVNDRGSLAAGQILDGPAIVLAQDGCLFVEPHWRAVMKPGGAIELTRLGDDAGPAADNDAIAMELLVRRMQGIAESMGEAIVRTSVSVNVRERRDFSCAIFRGDGTLLANAAHVPVHLGAMGHAIRSLVVDRPSMSPGDVYVSNDPYAGGSHLPDVTVMTPVFVAGSTARPCDYFVASRCHHAEIGGLTPGSMCPAATCLNDEGVVLRNLPLVQNGIDHVDSIERRLAGADYPSRSVGENLADLAAARAAGDEGAGRLIELIDQLGRDNVARWVSRWIDVAAESLDGWIGSMDQTPRSFADQLDDGTPVVVSVWADGGRWHVDFTGTGGVHPHGFNATPGIVTAAVMYVARVAAGVDLPMCDGVLRRFAITIPPGLLDPASAIAPGGNPRGLIDPRQLPAVVAGNVETSQRLVDVLLGALGIAAASQGTMNNLLIGDDTFGYYETMGGGAGASPAGPGAGGVHTHMTNTAITDPEVLETRLPVRLRRFGLRPGSGGVGRHHGGDGLIREFEFLRPLTVSMIASRRATSPYGINGGGPGQPGEAVWVRGGVAETLPGSFSRGAVAGDRLVIQTPGGGAVG